MAADDATTSRLELEAAIYERELASGRPAALARAYAESFVDAYEATYAVGLEVGIVVGRRAERDRLGAIVRGNAVHGPEAQRWLLARELDLSAAEVERWMADPDAAAIDGEAVPPAVVAPH